jgi:hypothetical protein
MNDVCLITVEGRRYRKYVNIVDPSKAAGKADQRGARKPSDRRAPQEAEGEEVDDELQADDEPNCQLEPVTNPDDGNEAGLIAGDEAEEGIERDAATGDWVARVAVPSAFNGLVIGKGGATRKGIEQDTGASITVPPQGSGAGSSAPIVIRGPSVRAVASARTRVELIAASALEQMDYTHFFSFPVPSLGQGVDAWKSRLQAAAAEGVDPGLFVASSQLNLLAKRSNKIFLRRTNFLRVLQSHILLHFQVRSGLFAGVSQSSLSFARFATHAKSTKRCRT